jgi:L-amino acid N-acyltransferase YncA
MLAVIGDSANTASIAVHRAFGFEPVGTLRSRLEVRTLARRRADAETPGTRGFNAPNDPDE